MIFWYRLIETIPNSLLCTWFLVFAELSYITIIGRYFSQRPSPRVTIWPPKLLRNISIIFTSGKVVLYSKYLLDIDLFRNIICDCQRRNMIESRLHNQLPIVTLLTLKNTKTRLKLNFQFGVEKFIYYSPTFFASHQAPHFLYSEKSLARYIRIHKMYEIYLPKRYSLLYWLQ